MQKKQISTNRPNSDAIKVDIVLSNVGIGGKYPLKIENNFYLCAYFYKIITHNEPRATF